MKSHALVVIGTSAGGVEALRTLFSRLDPEIPAVWCVTLHIGAHQSLMPSLLEEHGPLPALHVKEGERLRPGRIHLAPPDRHFLVENDRAVLSRGPRENFTRPAIDPMFRSAARARGRGVIGVILTGRLNDGAAGLFEVKAQGGLAVVQDPRDAAAPDMPEAALRHVRADHCVSLTEMPTLLRRLVAQIGEGIRSRPKATGWTSPWPCPARSAAARCAVKRRTASFGTAVISAMC